MSLQQESFHSEEKFCTGLGHSLYPNFRGQYNPSKVRYNFIPYFGLIFVDIQQTPKRAIAKREERLRKHGAKQQSADRNLPHRLTSDSSRTRFFSRRSMKPALPLSSTR